MTSAQHKPLNAQTIDVSERGAPIEGQPQTMNRRLFMKLSVYRTASGSSHSSLTKQVCSELAAASASAVVYQDMHDPRSLGVLLWHEQPKQILDWQGQLLDQGLVAELTPRDAFSMFGRTYSSGYEQDLEYWLIRRPMETVTNAQWPWAVWYPLRRFGSFETLSAEEQRAILGEHARIGRTYGTQDLAHDVRLACHGLDTHDNDFVIGLIGKDLHPLSHVVQSMRHTRQTSQYISHMGPFFIGHRVWSSAS